MIIHNQRYISKPKESDERVMAKIREFYGRNMQPGWPSYRIVRWFEVINSVIDE